MLVVFAKRRYYQGKWREVGETIDMPKVYFDAYSLMKAVVLPDTSPVHPTISSIATENTNEEVAEDEEVETVKEDLMSLTAVKLKEIAKEKGLPTYGTKQELVDRIKECL